MKGKAGRNRKGQASQGPGKAKPWRTAGRARVGHGHAGECKPREGLQGKARNSWGCQGKANEMYLQELLVYENSQAQSALSGLDPTWAVSDLHLKLLGHLLSCVCKRTVILVPEPQGKIWIACPKFNTCKH